MKKFFVILGFALLIFTGLTATVRADEGSQYSDRDNMVGGN